MKAIKVGKHYFKYDRERCIVKMYAKIKGKDLEMVKEENAFWQSKYGENLFDLEDEDLLYLDGAGLRIENWNNKEARNEYLAEMEMDFDEDVSYLIRDAI